MGTFRDVDGTVDAHEACENEFFATCRRRLWSEREIRAVMPNYFSWIRAFPGILGGLIGNTRDPDFQFFLTEILFSELGCGDPERMHFKLFERILRKLGLSEEEIHTGPRFAETRELVEGMRRLYLEEDILRAMGAQYALERQAFPMIEKLYVGFKHFDNLTREDFEYFELHLVEEPEHLRCMQECMARCMSSTEDAARVETGARECLDLIAAFWRRMYAEIVALEGAEPCPATET